MPQMMEEVMQVLRTCPATGYSSTGFPSCKPQGKFRRGDLQTSRRLHRHCQRRTHVQGDPRARLIRADPDCFASVRSGLTTGIVMDFGDGASRTVLLMKVTRCVDGFRAERRCDDDDDDLSAPWTAAYKCHNSDIFDVHDDDLALPACSLHSHSSDHRRPGAS